MEKEKKKKYVNKYAVILALIALLLSMLIPITYAYFTATVVGNNNASSSVVESGTMRLVFSDGSIIGITSDWVPGDSTTNTSLMRRLNTDYLENVTVESLYYDMDYYIRPSMYLKANVMVDSGEGTYEIPYKLTM